MEKRDQIYVLTTTVTQHMVSPQCKLFRSRIVVWLESVWGGAASEQGANKRTVYLLFYIPAGYQTAGC
jgi:hypothetical protein